MKSTILAAIGAVAMTCGAFAAGDTSEGLLVFTQAERSSFWSTAPGSTLTLPVRFPAGATSARLSVRGAKYSRDYADITTDTFTLTLPEATDETTEDVYELTQTFVGNAAVTNIARIGLIAGLANGATGSTRCLVGSETARWRRALPHSVIPVPCGMTSFSVDNTEVAEGDAGFTGAQGWYVLPAFALGSSVPVALTADEISYGTALTIWNPSGFMMLFR